MILGLHLRNILQIGTFCLGTTGMLGFSVLLTLLEGRQHFWKWSEVLEKWLRPVGGHDVLLCFVAGLLKNLV